MATTGALGNYYVDSFLLGADASDELGAGRYAPGAPTSAHAASSPRRRYSAPPGTRCTLRAPTRCPRSITIITTTPMCTPRRP
ncbi:Homeobox protein Hox-A9 [Myotis brandtii]|uniref:Homeobox protein Hox-A9 n=1 Tax=Myotis brandtii TaxID=109478 RepID=S7PCU6_MYOBR|nr:Homeobox protein Hox-A9 [Myotis brandtii]